MIQQQQEQQQSVVGGGGVFISKSRRYRLRKLPNYLLHLNRFKRTGFNIEKNPTIVMFPVKNFDLSSYIFSDDKSGGGNNEKRKDTIPTKEEIESMSIGELRNLLLKYDRSDLVNDVIEKSDLIKHCLDFCATSLPDLLTYKYDLVANITHDTPIEVGREGKQRNPLVEGRYQCHVQHGITGQWYEMEDLAVRETMPQLISVSESYILIFERKKSNTAGLGKT
jgi:U4/U6.U5 tri-snRNP-associated protein 2